MILGKNYEYQEGEIKLDQETLNTIRKAERRDFNLITSQIMVITDALESRLKTEADSKVKYELQGINREITQAIHYLTSEAKAISRVSDNPNHPKVWAATKLFEELKSNLIQAYTIVTEQKPDIVENKLNNPTSTIPQTNEFISPDISYNPTFDNIILPTDSVSSSDQLPQAANPDVQTAPDLISQPQSIDAAVNQSPEMQAFRDEVAQMRAEIQSLRDLIQNNQVQSDLLKADEARALNTSTWQEEEREEEETKQTTPIDNKTNIDTQTASSDASKHEQSFDSAIDDVLHEFGLDKLPDDFIEEKDILVINSLNSTSKDLSPEEEDFIARLRKYLNPKQVDQNANTQVRSNELTKSPNYTVRSPFRTAVTPYSNVDTQPIGQQTIQSNRVEDPLITQKGYLMDIFKKKTDSLTRIKFENMVANSPSIAQKHEQLIKASEDNTDMPTFKNLLYGLMAEIVRIDSMALPQNITQQGPSYNTMPRPITPASV